MSGPSQRAWWRRGFQALLHHGLLEVRDGENPRRGGPAPPGSRRSAESVKKTPDSVRPAADLLRLAQVLLPRTEDSPRFPLHLAWVDQGEGRYQGQMAVYVKPRGRLGKGYMALIKPFRHWVVYPALMRQMERTWRAGAYAGR